MKYIAAALAVLLTLSLSQFVAAKAPISSDTTPVTYTTPLAPVLDATQPPAPIAPPIFMADTHGSNSGKNQHDQQRAVDQSALRKPSVTDRFKELDRKRSSWFKRTFGGS